MLLTITLNAKTPCCHRAVKLVATRYVLTERYERTCKQCGFDWSIERRLIREQADARMDALDWMAQNRTA